MLYVNDSLPDFGLVAPEDPDGRSSWSTSVLVYCPNVDEVYEGAIAAGATQLTTPCDQFHGDRVGSLRDPWGHRWVIATRFADVDAAEMQRLTDEFLASSAG
jgi:PhnB protein